jgi:hypothetical protein
MTTVAVAPVGLTRTLFAVGPCLGTEAPGWPGSEVSAPSPSPRRSTSRGILSQALAPLQSFTNAPPWSTGFPTRAGKPTVHPFRGSFPFSVLPAVKSHIPPVSFHLTGYVAPLGFLNPSTLCSPHDLPGLFHPGSAHGVLPSRLFSPRNAVRLLRRRDPHAIGYGVETPHRRLRALLIPGIPH